MTPIPLSQLPSVSGADAVKALGKLGWVVNRKKGDHVILTKAGEVANVCVPQHRELKRPTLKNILESANVTVDEFKSSL